MIGEILEVVRPDTKRIATNALAIEVMSRILNDETDVFVPRKVDGKLNVSNTGCSDYIDGPSALRACRIRL
jgi:hypothetical protein